MNSDQKVRNTNIILDRIKQAHGLKTDKELADMLNINTTTLCTRRKNGCLQVHEIIKFCGDIDFDWLFKGDTKKSILLDDCKRLYPSFYSWYYRFFEILPIIDLTGRQKSILVSHLANLTTEFHEFKYNQFKNERI